MVLAIVLGLGTGILTNSVYAFLTEITLWVKNKAKQTFR